MIYLGDFKEDSTIYFCWDTNDKNGGSITRATNGSIRVYKDDGTVENTAGITDTGDFDSLTGIHNCKIDLSSDAFYSKGHDYSIVLVEATIDSESVNATLALFSIENRFGGSLLFEKAAKMLVNKAIQNKETGIINYYDNDGETIILTHTPNEGESTITRTSN